MKKTNWFKKILSFILAIVMVAGMIHMPAKAEEVVYTDAKIESFYTTGDPWFEPTLTDGNWRVYIKTSVALPAEGTSPYEFVMSNGTQEATVNFYADSTSQVMYSTAIPQTLVDGCKAQTITIKKGQYQSGTTGYGINLTEDFVFYVNGYSWSPVKANVTPTMEQKVTLTLNMNPNGSISTGGGTDGFYVKANIPDGAYIDTNWNQDNMKALSSATDGSVFHEGGVWKGETKSGYTLEKYAEQLYYVNVGTAEENVAYTVKGLFQDKDGRIVGYLPITVTWDGTTWTQTDLGVLEEYESTLTEKDASWHNPGKDTIQLKGTDSYLSGVGSNMWVDSYTILTPDSESGIFLGDNIATGAKLRKFNGNDGLYYVENLSDVVDGSIVTIRGTFYTADGKTKITYPQAKFVFSSTTNGWSDWTRPVYQGTLTKEGAEEGYDKNNWFTLAGTGAWSPTIDGTANVLKADTEDAESGIFIGTADELGIKQGNAAVRKNNAQWNLFNVESIPEATSGTVITIKGTFYSQDGLAAVTFAEAKFQWTGSSWIDFDGKASVAFTSLAVDKDYLAPKKNSGDGWAIWEFYLKTSVNVQTGATYYIDYKIDGDENVYTTNMQDLTDNDNVFYSKIDQDKIDEVNGTTITYLAGEYASIADSSQTMTITEDFTFHVNQYGWSTDKTKITPDLTNKVTLTHASDVGNGGDVNGFYLWADCDDGMILSEDWSKHLTPVSLSPGDTYYTSVGEGGLWKNGVKTTDVKITKFTYIDKPCYYVHASAEDGATYEVKGLFKDSNGRKVVYQPIKVTYAGAAWKQVYVGLANSGKQHDANSDSIVNSADLVRLIRHTDNNMISINDAQGDINYSGAVDKYDVDSLRKVLVGMISYANGKVYGTPVYNSKKVIEKMAYVCPAVGTWENENTDNAEFTPLPDAELDSILQKYKAAGFTLLNTENVAQYYDNDWNAEVNEPIRVYLEAAKRNNLGVLVFDKVIQYMLDQNNPAVYGDNWKGVIESHIQTLQNYSSFRGFVIWDEMTIEYVDTYNQIVSYIRESHPELLLVTSLLPVTVYDQTGDDKGVGALTTNESASKEEAYRDYIWSYAENTGHFIYDLYPLVYSENKIFGYTYKSQYGVVDDWYLNLQYVANEVKEHNYSFTTGITIQACKLTGWSNNTSSYETYAPEKPEDIGFQVYTAMAYGMKNINYFTYEDHWTDTVVDGGMTEYPKVYNAVSAVNAEIDKFANVYQSFSWKDTLDLAAGGDAKRTELSTRLTSAKATGARAFVGCMKDTDGFDGYMIANADGPRVGVASQVTLTFDDATSAIVYTDGVPKTVTLTGGVYEVTVPSGEGVFVIPLR